MNNFLILFSYELFFTLKMHIKYGNYRSENNHDCHHIVITLQK